MHGIHDLGRLLGGPYSEDDENDGAPRKRDGRTRAAREIRDTRRAFLGEFPHADELRLREATLLSIAVARLEPRLIDGDAVAIQTVGKLSNRLQCLRRELGVSAKHRKRESA
jgi:hypothetical protein